MLALRIRGRIAFVLILTGFWIQEVDYTMESWLMIDRDFESVKYQRVLKNLCQKFLRQHGVFGL